MGGVIGLISLDETVVAVAVPTIQRDLGLSVIGGHWVINIYLLFLAGLAAAGGRLGDIFGVKFICLGGLGVFGLASLAAGLAQDPATILIARAVQGVGAALVFPISLAIVTILFPPERRGFAVGVYGGIGTTFLALGPLFGGALTEFVSWRWIFWINVPIVLAIGAAVLAYCEDPPREPGKQTFDSVGMGLLVGGMGLVVFAVMQSSDWGWTSVTVWPVLIVGICLLTVFAFYEWRRHDPLIEVDLFRNKTVSACTLVLFTGMFAKTAFIVFGALYFQRELSLTAFEAGLALLPAVGLQAILAVPSGRFVDRVGTRLPTLLGVGGSALSLIWMGVAISWDNYVLLLPALIVWASVMGFLFIPSIRALPNAVAVEQQGQAGGIVMTCQLLGATIGIAVGSSLYAINDRFGIVFLGAGALAVVTFVVSWLAIRPEDAPSKMRRTVVQGTD